MLARAPVLVGHFAMGLLGKRAAPQISLGTVTVAAMLADLLGMVFIIAGLEHWRMIPGTPGIESVELYDIPLSHSLAMDVVWGALFGAVCADSPCGCGLGRAHAQYFDYLAGAAKAAASK